MRRIAEAVARIYAAKGRPSFNPLIVHVPDLAAAEALAMFDDTARALAAAFWPGPLTIVAAAQARCTDRVDRDRGARHDRAALPRARRDAGAAQGQRTAARRTFGQCQRADQPDARRACRRQPRRTDPADRRRRRDRAGHRIDDRRTRRWRRQAAPARPGHARADHRRLGVAASRRRATARSRPPVSSPAITRPPSPCGSTRPRHATTNG